MRAELLTAFETLKIGKKYEVVPMDMFWLIPEERGGIAVVLGPLNYLRLTFPNGTETQYNCLFKVLSETT